MWSIGPRLDRPEGESVDEMLNFVDSADSTHEVNGGFDRSYGNSSQSWGFQALRNAISAGVIGLALGEAFEELDKR